METIKVVCPHCHSVNRIPKKDTYKKAVCGKCKGDLLDNRPISVNESEFYTHINNSDIPVFVDFWAEWCGPCKMFAPVFEQVSQQFPLKAQFIKVNTEQNQNIAMQFQIRSIPTIAVFKNGAELNRVSGAMDAVNFSNYVRNFI